MGQLFATVLACAAALASWSLSAALAEYQLAAGNLGALLFFAPVVGLALPAAIWAFSCGGAARGFWVLAGAPLLGGVNLALYSSYVTKSGTPAGSQRHVAAIFSTLWQIPLAGFLISAFLNEARTGRSNVEAPNLFETNIWPPASATEGVAGPYVKKLRDRGYEVRSRRAFEWQVVAPDSEIIQYIRSIEQLKAVALELDSGEA